MTTANPVGPGVIGRLAVKGPTGCRYLADERQLDYVLQRLEPDRRRLRGGRRRLFLVPARTDDMIISAGYNIAGPKSRTCCCSHPAVAECGVVGAPDEERGQIVEAYVVLRPASRPVAGDGARAAGLRQAAQIAPYKYPRRIEFRSKPAAHRNRQAAALQAAPGSETGTRMNIVCIGGGPAGLYFALLMKKQDPAHEITVIERNRPYDTFGWGVVFSDQTLGNLVAPTSRPRAPSCSRSTTGTTSTSSSRAAPSPRAATASAASAASAC
jgi:acyl-CoA synthetase (AMP-forming)/AMP-acid ligase II